VEEDEEDEREGPASHEVPLATISVPGGKIRMFFSEKDDGTMELFAKAICDSHTKCTIRRSLLSGARVSQRARGRPLGYLAAWLLKGMCADCGTQHCHVWETVITRDERVAGRHVCEACEGIGEFMERDPWPEELEDGEPIKEPPRH